MWCPRLMVSLGANSHPFLMKRIILAVLGTASIAAIAFAAQAESKPAATKECGECCPAICKPC